MINAQFEAEIEATFKEYPIIQQTVTGMVTYFTSNIAQNVVELIAKSIGNWAKKQRDITDFKDFKQAKREFRKLVLVELDKKKKWIAEIGDEEASNWVWRAVEYLANKETTSKIGSFTEGKLKPGDLYMLTGNILMKISQILVLALGKEIRDENKLNKLLEDMTNEILEELKEHL